MRPPTPAIPKRFLLLVLLSVVPWVVVIADGEIGLVFAWGLVNPDPLHVTSITSYLFVHTRGLPDYLLAWPIAVLLFGVALASALSGRWIREDPRVTGGLLVLVGLSLLVFARGIGRPASIVSIPIGTVAVLIVAWWIYWPAVRQTR